MSIKSLPARPDLGQLKKQAKELLDAVRADEAAARKRIAQAGGNDAAEKFALSDAQRVIAREHGFPSWAKLKLHVETRTADPAEERLIEAALEGDAATVRTLRAERPALATRSVYAAAALGEADAVRAELARTKGGPRDWEPLLYVCFGRVGAGDGERAAIAKQLLANGADANAAWIHQDWPEARLSALYGATGVNNYPRLARVQLTAGANPNDGESRYHAAEHNHTACLEVLAEFGADFSGADKTWGNTPLYFLFGYMHASAAVKSGVRWLLEHGANPNAISHAGTTAETALHAAVNHDWDVDTIGLLLRHGADPAAKRADGRTALALAVRGGRGEIAGILRAHGAPGGVSIPDEFLGACMRADAAAARALLRKEPGLTGVLTAEDRKLVLTAAREGRAAAVSLMGELGFDLEVEGEDGERALHWAAWHGWAETVRSLVARRVELNRCDRRYGAPPSGWCAHGSQFCGNPAGEHGKALESLIAAGAFVPPDTGGSAEVMVVLKKHGLGRARTRRK